MGFVFSETDVCGVMRINTHSAYDHRGCYSKVFERGVFQANGIEFNVTECSDIYSKRGVIRGLHYQTVDSQAKLIHVISGSIYDIALDLRPASKSFGRWHSELLRGGDGLALYIPQGFAHGFLALEDNTIFSYQCSGRYLPSACGGIRYDDKELAIPWPLEGMEPILSDKDSRLQSFAEYREAMCIK